MDMIGRIHADLFFQDRYRLNEVNVKDRFITSWDSFSLIENRIGFESVILYVRKVKLSSAVFVAHAKALESTNAKYPLRRVVCKSVTILQEFFDLMHEKLFSSQLPNRIIIRVVQNDAFSGNRTCNPFNFQNSFNGNFSLC